MDCIIFTKTAELFFLQGEFVRKAEIIFSANYFGVDEDKGADDGERILDRVAAIPFVEWEEIFTTNFVTKHKQFKRVVNSPQKSTTLLVGEIRDFIRS